MWIEIREDANTKDLNYIPYRFTSKEWDSETGLYSFPARYFEPKLSRWMSADPAGFEIIDPQENSSLLISAANWYSYSENNPVKYKDPDGKLPTVVVGAITGGLIGAIAGGISAVSQGKTSFRDIAAGAAGGAISAAATGALVGNGVGLVAVAAGSFVGGAAGSAAENVIAHGAKNLDAGAVAKDAAIDGAISAGPSFLTVGRGKMLGKAAGKIAENMRADAVSKALKGQISIDSLKGSLSAASTLETGVKPALEGLGVLASDIIQDGSGPDTVTVDRDP